MEHTGTPLAEIKTVAELKAFHLWGWGLWFLMGLKSGSCTLVISVSDFRTDTVNDRGFSQNLHPLSVILHPISKSLLSFTTDWVFLKMMVTQEPGTLQNILKRSSSLLV